LIRTGTLSDLPQLASLGERMRLESLIWYPPIDPQYLAGYAKIIFSRPDKFCCFVVEKGSNIVGWLNGFETGYIFSPVRIAAHDIFYIAPEHRRYEYAVGLIRAYIGWAESLGLKRQVLRLDTALRPEKVDRFYRRLGFQPIGGQYVRDNGGINNDCWNR
jgi:GNAT superfamily N-acetyltransferase